MSFFEKQKYNISYIRALARIFWNWEVVFKLTKNYSVELNKRIRAAVDRWCRKSMFLSKSKREVPAQVYSSQFCVHKKWSFALRISSVNATKSAIWSHLLKKSLMGNFIFCAVSDFSFQVKHRNCHSFLDV